jgi:hypothetical protein
MYYVYIDIMCSNMPFFLWHVKSRDRVTDARSDINYSSSNFYWTSSQAPGNLTLKAVTAVELDYVSIPSTYYNFVSGLVTFRITRDTGGTPNAFNIGIASGFYTISTLISALQTALDAADAGVWTISASDSSGLISITCTTPGTGTSIKFANSTDPYEELGFTYSSGADQSFSSTITATNVYNLNKYNFIYIKVDEFGQAALTTNQADSPTFIIPNIVPSKDIIYEEYESNKQRVVFSPPRSLDKIRVRLYLPGATTPVSLNGAEWEMILRVYYQ